MLSCYMNTHAAAIRYISIDTDAHDSARPSYLMKINFPSVVEYFNNVMRRYIILLLYRVPALPPIRLYIIRFGRRRRHDHKGRCYFPPPHTHTAKDIKSAFFLIRINRTCKYCILRGVWRPMGASSKICLRTEIRRARNAGNLNAPGYVLLRFYII